jgi:23S rRNA pseudouridine1911/1915/1917 synthase
MEEKKIEVVFENEDWLVINKPAGYVTTNENNNSLLTVENWLKKNRKNNLAREGIVHRLDKGTSGLLLIAKNQRYLDIFKNKFKSRQVEKKYLALVGGDVVSEGQIKVPIVRSKYSFGKFGVGVDGKEALSLFKVIKKYKYDNKIYSLVEVQIKTGRTHQIRVHFAYLGWPLVGDRVYGGILNFDLQRPFLHAYSLSMKDNFSYKIELPEELKDHLVKYNEQT